MLTNMNISVLAAANGENEKFADWDFVVFGNGANENPNPIYNNDGSITMEAQGGKISSSVDGISFLYQALPIDANFQINATAIVHQFGANNQVSFGIMLRDEVGKHQDSSGHEANYVSIGTLDQSIKGFYKQDTQKKLKAYDEKIPVEGNQYNFKIKKTGDVYILSVNGEVVETLTLEKLFSKQLYAGIFVAREAKITFSDLTLNIDHKEVESLQVDDSKMKTNYLVNEEFDVRGLKVKAVYSDGSSEELLESDYVITGFDSSQAGKNTINIQYNGIVERVDLYISELTITELDIRYYPAKTTYYLGDSFDPQGLVIDAIYNEGYQTSQLSEDAYFFEIEGERIELEHYRFDRAGDITLKIIPKKYPEKSTTFNVYVQESELLGVSIVRAPIKQLYFIGESLNLDGLQVNAKYSDGQNVLLTRDEYTVSDFDSSLPDKKELTIHHKDKTVTFSVNVKEREIEGLTIMSYPKTTYVVGEKFVEEGLKIGLLYDNGDQEALSKEDYTLKTNDFNRNQPGTYTVHVTANNKKLASITFHVTVREKATLNWQEIRFGQSTSDDKNYIKKQKNGAIRIVAEEGGGKVTGDHDGISFYYTELNAEKDNFILSADIKVNEYAKSPHDGQESFGIMARDAIGKAGNSGVFASNIAAIGGYSGGTNAENGTQLFARTGVIAADGEGSEGIQNRMLLQEQPNAENTKGHYRLTLAKTNSGITGRLNNGEEDILYEPDILNVQDNKMYVGFYAARLADIEISNIDLIISEAATDPPKVEAPAEPLLLNLKFYP
ncbi:bacterial Ig-like domain-containing protein [Lederbergia galactosidilytica]|uniref:bacterial Ig-like domain-containing protein n=1 Tax=Lederbergia galactosidilytica TaxID=217031 RepID=UPI001AE6FAC3|nr:bacterial Ig-like domain-containing protein [Lederbergia galactosidilytica]